MSPKIAPFTLLLLILLGACGGPPDTPEQRVRNLIRQAQEAAEARDWRALGDLVADDYRDKSGYDRRQVLRLAAGYMLRNQRIHLFTRIASIDAPSPDQARATVYAAMAGSPVGGVEQLFNLSADLMRFDLELRTDADGDFRIVHAAWKRARPEDFAPYGVPEE